MRGNSSVFVWQKNPKRSFHFSGWKGRQRSWGCTTSKRNCLYSCSVANVTRQEIYTIFIYQFSSYFRSYFESILSVLFFKFFVFLGPKRGPRRTSKYYTCTFRKVIHPHIVVSSWTYMGFTLVIGRSQLAVARDFLHVHRIVAKHIISRFFWSQDQGWKEIG